MADGPKVIEFRSSDSGGGNSSSGTSLVPFDKAFADRQIADYIAAAMSAAMDAQKPYFVNADGTINDRTWGDLKNDMLGGGGNGNDDPPDDPFSFMDDDGRFVPDDVRNWLNELEEEYKTQAELIERSNDAFDDLTKQADSLTEEQEGFSFSLEHLDTAVEITTFAFLSLISASLAYNKVVNELVEAVGGFSADVVQASMRSRLQEIEDRLQLATQAGATIADLEMTRSDLASEYRQLLREVVELAGPTLNTIGQLMTEGVRIIRQFAEDANDFKRLQEQMDLFKAAMQAANEGNVLELIRIRKLMEEANRPATEKLNASIDALFDPDNVFEDDDENLNDPLSAPLGFSRNQRGF